MPVFKRALAWVAYDLLHYRRSLIAAYPLLSTEPPAPSLPDDMRIGPFGASDLAPLAALGAEETERTAERLARGDRPWGLWKGDRLVSYGWSTQTGAHFSTWWSIRLDGLDVYLYNFFTHPDHRGQGYYSLLLRAICAELADSGAEWVWIATSSYNPQSWRGIRKAGFRPAATHVCLLGRFDWLRVEPGMPRPAITFLGRPPDVTP